MVGGMANLTFRDIAEQYFDAASAAVGKDQERRLEDHRLANPVLYLYRHSIELFIKAALVGAPKTHDLDKIVPQFRALHKSKFGAHLADWINHRLKELARYRSDNNGIPLQPELWTRPRRKMCRSRVNFTSTFCTYKA